MTHVTREDLGLSPKQWALFRLQSQKLGAPLGTEDPAEVAGFSYATIEKPRSAPGTTNLDRLRDLIIEAEKQRLPTLAHPMLRFPDVRVLEQPNRDSLEVLAEALIPVLPDTAVKPPLVLRQQPTLRVIRTPRGIPTDQRNRVLDDRVREARSRGLVPVSPLYLYYSDEDWFSLLKQGKEPDFEVFVPVAPR